MGDLTLADCSVVGRSATVTKVWRFRNTGTVTWSGYSLQRIDQNQDKNDCQTITDIPVPRTGPGQTVDIRVEITTPARATFCMVRYKMMAPDGRAAFPDKRPVNFQLVVR